MPKTSRPVYVHTHNNGDDIPMRNVKRETKPGWAMTVENAADLSCARNRSKARSGSPTSPPCSAVATAWGHRTDGSQSPVSPCRRWRTGRLPGLRARVRHPQVLSDGRSRPPTTFVRSRTSTHVRIALCRPDRPRHRIFVAAITIGTFYHTPPRLRLPPLSSPDTTAAGRYRWPTDSVVVSLYIAVNLLLFI